MIKAIKYLALFGSLFYIIVNVSSCGANLSRPHNGVEELPQPEYIDICDLKSRESDFNNQVIKVKGTVDGYHEVVLFSDRCPAIENYLQLDITSDDLGKIAGAIADTGVQVPVIKGEAYVSGTFIVGGGELFQYPPRAFDTKSPNGKAFDGLIVNRLRLVKIQKLFSSQSNKLIEFPN